MERVLVTGACGQLGSELSVALANRYGQNNVIVSDLKEPVPLISGMPFEPLDVLRPLVLETIVAKYKITQIYHLAALLSAKGEQHPQIAWKLNIDGLINILEVSRKLGVNKIFWPSSIAAFGPNTPSIDTPQICIMDPNTIYGISKLAGELWCNYYNRQFGLDIRSVRYPGLISYKAPPGGGTTDYAIDIFHSALKGEKFVCFLREDTQLPMMYMPDAIKAALDLMSVPAAAISVKTSYNISAINFTPKQLAAEISRHIEDFEISYRPDYRQQIAASWPQSVDDRQAVKDWSWKPDYDISAMTKEMINNLTLVDSSN